MTDYRAMFDRNYIYAWELGGHDHVVIITRVKAETLTSTGNKKAKKPVLWFEGKERGLAINKTNARTIAAMYGNDTSKWIGRPITIYPTMTQFGSDTVECIRVRPQVPEAPTGRKRPPASATPRQLPPAGDADGVVDAEYEEASNAE